MCSIAGMLDIKKNKIRDIGHKLTVINDLQKHRGPDGSSVWAEQGEYVGFAHNRLSILDLTDAGRQPMRDVETGNVVCFNGEIYNYIELREGNT